MSRSHAVSSSRGSVHELILSAYIDGCRAAGKVRDPVTKELRNHFDGVSPVVLLSFEYGGTVHEYNTLVGY